MQVLANDYIKKEKKIGFVPTMGALHAGHIKLIKKAKKHSDIVVVSVFINPLQFGPKEDYKRYPKKFYQDKEILKEEEVDVLFYPNEEEMYPADFSTYLEECDISNLMCGKSRPGHFKGVATIVLKLLLAVKPVFLYMGQKDAQQAAVIKRIVRDINLDIKVVVVSTARESKGLAISSRNGYLSDKLKQEAVIIFRSLSMAKQDILKGKVKDVDVVINMVKKILKSKMLIKIEYIQVLTYPDFKTIRQIRGKVIIAVAVWLGKVRLIDNIIVEAK